MVFLKHFLPELFLTSVMLLLLFFSTASTANFKNVTKYNRQAYFVFKTLLVSFIICLIYLIEFIPNSTYIFYSNTLISDELSILVKIVLLFSTTAWMAFSYDDLIWKQCDKYEYLLIILLSLLGMCIAISSYHFLSMYLAIELQSICFYILASFKRNELFSAEAGLRYFVLGAFASNFMLFGCSIIYGYTSICSFGELGLFFSSFEYNQLNLPLGIYLGSIFLLVSFLFKLSSSPFHMWVPDVYEGSPLSSTAFFIIVPKLVILVLIIRLYYNIFYIFIENIKILFIFASISSIIIGTFGALEQTKIKRFLAYSTISNVGYLLIGLSTGTSEGIQASILYMIIYIVMSISLFSILLSINSVYADKKTFFSNEKKFIDLRNLNHLYINDLSTSTLKWFFIITLFSMAGIPPFAGFFGKFYLFLVALKGGEYLLCTIGLLMSIISAIYYIRLIKIIYEKNLMSSSTYKNQLYYHYDYYSPYILSYAKLIPLIFSSIFIIFFFINPSTLFFFTHQVVLLLSF